MTQQLKTSELQDYFDAELAFLNLMLDASIDCIKLINLSGELIKINNAGRIALGLDADSIHHRPEWLGLLPADIRGIGKKALQRACAGKKSSFFGRSELPGKKPVVWENILTPILDDRGNITLILCLSRDVTRQKEAELRLRAAGETDALTKLPNRRALMNFFLKLRKKCLRTNDRIGLLIFDVDDFKQINDAFGHEAGDIALCNIAKGFQRVKKADEFIARLGGDEFAILTYSQDPAASLQSLVERLSSCLQKKNTFMSHEFHIKISIGGSISDSNLESLSEIMRRADNALYLAKSKGKSNFQLTE
ncbi:GGDEF domain-containing protein [Pseudomonas sp. LRF_L74]|uniref:GGDEF domain-containing protein n=1 Tax=Pseudomonas sp. LRF_L74 TaxID=3369422 RepID=UPI003F627E8C